MDEVRLNSLRRAYEGRIRKANWIGEVLNRTLRPINPGATVISLAVGMGEELPHIRTFAGPTANIHAYDILHPSSATRDLSMIADVSYHREGIQNVDKVIRTAGGNPELIICRAPRILESISPKDITFNKWWIPVLTEYARRISGRGQMLITTYTREELDLIIEDMNKNGIDFIVGENDLCPISLPTNYTGPQGRVKAGIDSYTLVVG